MNEHIRHTRLPFSCGAGEASVNVRTGRLIFAHPDFSIGKDSYNIGVTHIYNPEMRNHPDINTGMGNGWKLNVQQYLIKNSTHYTYYDGTGCEHIFERYNYSKTAFDIPNPLDDVTPSGILEKRISYKVTSKYFDTTGTGLTLKISEIQNSSGEAQISSYTAEISDASGNKMSFDSSGRLTSTVSAQNSAIKKIYKYSESQLTEIYDERKKERKIVLSYSNGQLSSVQYTPDDIEKSLTLFYEYDTAGNLVSITRSANAEIEAVAYFEYNTNNDLIKAVDGKDFSALGIDYNKTLDEDTYKVSKISLGCCKIENTYDATLRDAIFLGDGTRLGEPGAVCGLKQRTVTGFKLSGLDTMNENLKAWTEFSYNLRIGYSTMVSSNKNIDILYYLNKKGFTTSVLERKSTTDFRTLTKDGGEAVGIDTGTGLNSSITTGADTSTTRINNNLAFTLNLTTTTPVKLDLNGFLETHKNKKRFVLSFWLRHGVSAPDGHEGIKIALSGTSCPPVFIDHTAILAWQYVTIPFETDSTNISAGLQLSSTGTMPTSLGINIANIRVTVAAPSPKMKIKSTNGYYDLDSFPAAILNNETKSINANFFFTESDIKQTRMNFERGVLEVLHNGGTGRKAVQNFDSFTLINSYGLKSIGTPYYIDESYTPEKDKPVKIETSVSFDNVNKRITSTTTASGGGKNEVDEETIVTDYLGKIISKTDPHKIKTEYTYDTYGSVKTVKVSGKTDTDKVLTYSYDYIENEHLGKASSNGIVSDFTYLKPYNILETAKGVDYDGSTAATVKHSYDSYGRLRGVSAKKQNDEILAQNLITYDARGRVDSVSDSPDYRYGFEYDSFGNAVKYTAEYTNAAKQNVTDTLLTKAYNYDYNDGADKNISKVEEKYFRNGGAAPTDTITAISDKYGRPVQISTTGLDSGTVFYTYQNDLNGNDVSPYKDGDLHHSNRPIVNESPSVAKISQIYDSYEDRFYNYHYNLDNQPCGYSTSSASKNGDVKGTRVQQLDANRTEYRYDETKGVAKESYTIETKYDGNLLSPRVDEIICSDSDCCSIKYTYDSLGRIDKKSRKGINRKTVDGYGTSFNYLDSVNLTYNSNNCLESMKFNTEGFSTQYNYTYTKRGQIESENGIFYTYDSLNRLASEKNSQLEIDYEYIYNKYYSEIVKGRLGMVKNKATGATVKEFEYDGLGRLVSANNYLTGETKYFNYDGFGNVSSGGRSYKNGKITVNEFLSVEYVRGNLMSYYANKQGENKYFYNHEGVRFKKTTAAGTTTYWLDGGKILREYRPDGTKLRYHYDNEGINGMDYFDGRDWSNYIYIRDGQGNVRKILKVKTTTTSYIDFVRYYTYVDEVAAEYEYTAFGETKVKYSGSNDIGNINPFRWKGHYYDVETEFYSIYQNGRTRYYDPFSTVFLDAEGPESLLLNAASLGDLNRQGTGLNPMWLQIYVYTAMCAMGMLLMDPTCETPEKEPTWLEKNMSWLIPMLMYTAGAVLSFIPGMQGLAFMFMMGGTMGMVNHAFGSHIGGGIGSMMNGAGAIGTGGAIFTCHPIFAVALIIVGLVTMGMGANEVAYGTTGTNYVQSWLGMSDGAYNATYLGLNIAAAIGTIAGNLMSVCFAEGTQVHTEEGNKNIEDIEVGDKVLAYDEKTGEKAFKEVVRLFRNSTLTTNTHYFEGEKEPIICTPEHPFYILNTTAETPIVKFEGREESNYNGQWVQSKYLKVGDQVLLSDGKTVILTKTETEHLSEPITTYNFEVADFHTYYVGEQGILVHNACPPDLYRGGNKMNVRTQRDIDIVDGLVQPTRGISVNSNPNAVANFGGAHKIGALPDGLKIVHTAGTHFEIAPAYAMTLESYQNLLYKIPLIPIG